MNPLLALILLILIAGCSNDRHSGVMTETHTGAKIAGIVKDSLGIPLSARVRLVHQSDSAAGLSPEMQVHTDSAGRFVLDSIPIGLWYLLVTDTVQNLVWVQEVQWIHSDPQDLNVGILQVMPAASLAIDIASYDLQLGDTLFVLGTDASLVINDQVLTIGTAILNWIPANQSYELMRKNQDTSQTVLSIEPLDYGQQVLISNDSVIQSSLRLKLQFADSIALQAGDVHNMPMPVWMPQALQSPCLMTQQGQMMTLDSTLSQGDSILYWGNAPILELSQSSLIEFHVYENCNTNGLQNVNLGRLNLHMDQESDSNGVWGNSLWIDTTSPPYMVSPFTTFIDSSSVGVALWIKILASEQSATYIRIMESSSNGSGFVLQQKANRSTVELRIDTKDGDYNALFGASDLLDGQWHHYAFSIHNNQITVVADGNLITDTTFNVGSGFTNSTNPLIGNIPNMRGHVDEVMFFDGTQSASWYKVLYALQKPTVQWIKTP